MAMRFLLLLSLTLLLILTGPADTPAAAPAAPGATDGLYTRTVVASDTASAGTFGVERVLCPAGMVAVGGGVDVENVITMKVTSSAPTFLGDDQRLLHRPDGINAAPIGWQASVLNTAAVTQEFKVAVICAPPTGVSTMVASDIAVADSFGVERVLCPAGSVALGGGIDLANVLTMQVSSTAPTFDADRQRLIFQPDGANPAPIGWQASALNNSGTNRGFKVAVICAPLAGVSAIVGSDTAPADSFGVERTVCPAGKVAVGGGIDPANVLTMEVTASGPTFAADMARLLFRRDGEHGAATGWQATAYNGTTGDRTVKVAAVCVPGEWRVAIPAIYGP